MLRMSSFGPASGPVPQPSREPAPAPPKLDYKLPQAAPRRAPEPVVPWIANGLIKRRKLAILASLIPIIVSFNGRWRMGLDSSIYRGLARSIASGKGYHFGDFGTHQVYPGLPMLLAGIARIFGEHVFRPIVPLLLMVGMALLTLLLVYHLIARNYPQWIAICVVSCMGVNSWFVRLSQEVLTDMPFLLGAIAALLGWDMLRTARDTNSRAKAAILMSAGLALAAVMRPTFWILVLALVCYWAWGLIRGIFKGGWQLYACCLGILALLCVGFWALDPRTGAFHPLSGGYEAEMLESLQEGKAPQMDAETAQQPLRVRIVREIRQLFGSHLAATFLGQELPAFANVTLAVLLVGSSLLVARKQPVWAMFMVFTVCITLMLSTAPRYYVMILPFLLLGAFLLLSKIGEWVGGGWHDPVWGIAILPLLVLNIAKIVPFVFEQQRVPFYESGMRFYDTYRSGKFAPVIHLADLVREKVPTGARVITPSAQIVRYLSDREVMMERELVSAKRGIKHYPERLASLNIVYAAFPAKIYIDKEPTIAQLIKHGVIVQGKRIGEVDGIRLAHAIILIPPGDWTKAVAPTTRPTTKKAKSTTKPTTTQLAAKERKAKRAAASQAATKPAKKRKRPTTAPATQPSVL